MGMGQSDYSSGLSAGSGAFSSVDPMMSSGLSDVGGSGGGMGGMSGIMGMLGGLLKDPQVMKEVSGLGSKLGSVMDAGNKMSPRTREMLTKAIQQGTRPKQSMTPFVGDMMNYITPDMAKGTLSELGIPTARFVP